MQRRSQSETLSTLFGPGKTSKKVEKVQGAISAIDGQLSVILTILTISITSQRVIISRYLGKRVELGIDGSELSVRYYLYFTTSNMYVFL